MQIALIIALSLHILSAVFWAGTSFTLARTGGAGGEQLFRPQMGAAVIAVLTGLSGISLMAAHLARLNRCWRRARLPRWSRQAFRGRSAAARSEAFATEKPTRPARGRASRRPSVWPPRCSR